MKTLILVITMAVMLPSLLTAQMKPVNKSSKQVPQKTEPSQIKTVKQSGENKTMVKPPVNQKAVDVLRNNSGNHAYTVGDGVILDPLHMRDAATGSELYLEGVSYGIIEYELIRDNTLTSLTQYPDNGPRQEIYAKFKDLPSASHSYLITIGTNANANFTEMRLQYQGTEKVFSKNQFITENNPPELQLPFTFNAVYEDGFSLEVWVYYNYPTTRYSVSFNYLKLRQLD
jgi:hypothetical protein